MRLLTNNKGFTLIELLVVVSIIGTLATIILSSLGRARTKATETVMLVELKQLQKSIESFNLFNNRYPTTGDEQVGSYIIASSCDSPTRPEYRRNWNDMTDDMGDYLPSSFNDDDSEWPFCILYMSPAHENCPSEDSQEYSILFGTYDSTFAGVDSYENLYEGDFNCLYPLD